MHLRAQGLLEHEDRLSRPAADFAQQVAPGTLVTFEADRIVARARNGRRETLVFDNAHFGRMMMVEGVLRTSSADEFIYHEMMSHVPLLAHGDAERVLIVGGADFGLAEEVLKHRRVAKLVQVESDRQTLNLARAHFGGVNAPVFEDDRFDLRVVDGATFLATAEERFDLILVDMPDPVGMEVSPLTQDFLRSARSCLAPGGLLIARLGVPFLQPLAFSVAIRRFSAVFTEVGSYLVTVPSALGGPVAIGWASNVLRPEEPGCDVLAARLSDAFIGTHYYTPEFHRAAFALPQLLNNIVSAATRPDEDDRS